MASKIYSLTKLPERNIVTRWLRELDIRHFWLSLCPSVRSPACLSYDFTSHMHIVETANAIVFAHKSIILAAVKRNINFVVDFPPQSHILYGRGREVSSEYTAKYDF